MPMYAASLVNESEKELGLVEKKHVLSYREAIARDTDYDENEVGMNEEWQNGRGIIKGFIYLVLVVIGVIFLRSLLTWWWCRRYPFLQPDCLAFIDPRNTRFDNYNQTTGTYLTSRQQNIEVHHMGEDYHRRELGNNRNNQLAEVHYYNGVNQDTTSTTVTTTNHSQTIPTDNSALDTNYPHIMRIVDSDDEMPSQSKKSKKSSRKKGKDGKKTKKDKDKDDTGSKKSDRSGSASKSSSQKSKKSFSFKAEKKIEEPKSTGSMAAPREFKKENVLDQANDFYGEDKDSDFIQAIKMAAQNEEGVNGDFTRASLNAKKSDNKKKRKKRHKDGDKQKKENGSSKKSEDDWQPQNE